jgi:hypothetical protein
MYGPTFVSFAAAGVGDTAVSCRLAILEKEKFLACGKSGREKNRNFLETSFSLACAFVSLCPHTRTTQTIQKSPPSRVKELNKNNPIYRCSGAF